MDLMGQPYNSPRCSAAWGLTQLQQLSLSLPASGAPFLTRMPLLQLFVAVKSTNLGPRSGWVSCLPATWTVQEPSLPALPLPPCCR